MSAAVGAGGHSRLRPIWVGGIVMGAALALAVMAAFLVSGRAIASVFIGDPAVIATAKRLLIIAAIFQVFDGAQVISSSALRGLTDVRVPAAITFVAYWIIALPAGYLLGIRGPFGPAGIWTGLAAGLAAAAVMLGLRFLRLSRPGHDRA
jgi:MATE family multidrug resistance protein